MRAKVSMYAMHSPQADDMARSAQGAQVTHKPETETKVNQSSQASLAAKKQTLQSQVAEKRSPSASTNKSTATATAAATTTFVNSFVSRDHSRSATTLGKVIAPDPAQVAAAQRLAAQKAAQKAAAMAAQQQQAQQQAQTQAPAQAQAQAQARAKVNVSARPPQNKAAAVPHANWNLDVDMPQLDADIKDLGDTTTSDLEYQNNVNNPAQKLKTRTASLDDNSVDFDLIFPDGDINKARPPAAGQPANPNARDAIFVERTEHPHQSPAQPQSKPNPNLASPQQIARTTQIPQATQSRGPATSPQARQIQGVPPTPRPQGAPVPQPQPARTQLSSQAVQSAQATQQRGLPPPPQARPMQGVPPTTRLQGTPVSQPQPTRAQTSPQATTQSHQPPQSAQATPATQQRGSASALQPQARQNQGMSPIPRPQGVTASKSAPSSAQTAATANPNSVAKPPSPQQPQ